MQKEQSWVEVRLVCETQLSKEILFKAMLDQIGVELVRLESDLPERLHHQTDLFHLQL